MQFDRVVHGGLIATAADVFRADLGIQGEQIAAIAERLPTDRAEVLDAEGLIVVPGGVDVHTHLDSESDGLMTADDFFSGTVAAACGGITTICDYAHQVPGQSIHQTLDVWREKAAGRAVLDYGFHVIVTDVGHGVLDEIAGLISAGYPSYKTFLLRELTLGDEGLLALLRVTAQHGGIVNVHAEDGTLLADAVARLHQAGKRDVRHFAESRPAEAEVAATQHAIAYAEYAGARLYVVHVSAAGAVAAIHATRARGTQVRGETRPIYLGLTRDCYAQGGVGATKMVGAPPIRDVAHQQALWQALHAGDLHAVGSDHTTWTPAQKALGVDDFTRVRYGVPGLETEMPIVFSEGVSRGRLPLTRFVEITSTTPARLFGLYPRKGTIAVGSDADLALFDPQLRVTIDEQRMHSRAGYDPFHGQEVTGWPVMTLSRGEVIVRNGECSATRGRGRLIERRNAGSRAEQAHQPALAVA